MIKGIMANIDVKMGVTTILARVEAAYLQRSKDLQTRKPRLVSVSKTKPIEAIIEAYSTGQRHFGENYANEIIDKGLNEQILKECGDIKWHYIGRVQTNKINKIVKIPGLYMIETIDSEKLANNVDKAWAKIEKPDKGPLKVFLQINTSGEEEKNGIAPGNVTELYRYVNENCKNLKLEGLMTIGRFGHDYSAGPNPDFECLLQCHKIVCETFNLNPADVQLSMGMSDDFEHAIQRGSTNVRVGSSIFGYRPKKNEGNSNANDASGGSNS